MNTDNLRKLVRYFFKDIGLDVDTDEIEQKAIIPAINSISLRCGSPIYPDSDDSLAVSIMKPKTAALAFDKVYRVPIMVEPVPEEIGFYGATDIEMSWWGAALIYLAAHKAGVAKGSAIFSNENKDNYGENEKKSLKFICSQFPSIFHRSPTIFYNNKINYQNDFKIGKEQILTAVITNVAMVDEDKLEWKQVLEFRKDTDAKIKYKRFMRWIDSELIIKTPEQIEELIAIKLNDYEWSLKKHGVQTLLGTVSSIIDSKFLATATAATATAAFTGGEFWATMTSIGLVIGKMLIGFGTKYIEGIEERRKDNYEIAYIYEAKKKMI